MTVRILFSLWEDTLHVYKEEVTSKKVAGCLWETSVLFSTVSDQKIWILNFVSIFGGSVIHWVGQHWPSDNKLICNLDTNLNFK